MANKELKTHLTFLTTWIWSFWFPHFQESIWSPYKPFPTVTQRISGGSRLVNTKDVSALLRRDQRSPGRTWLEVRGSASSNSFLQSAPWRVCPDHVGLWAICLRDRKPRAGKLTSTSWCVEKCGTNCCCHQWPVPPYWPCPRPSAKGRRQIRAVFET